MAQALLRRPAIDLRPQHARIAQFLAFAAHRAKPCLAIGVERLGMVERVGVEVDPRDAAGEGALDGAVEQPWADTPADVGERQAEEGELVVAQFEVADQVAVVAGDMQFVVRLVEQRLQSGVATAAGARTTARDGRRDRRARDRARPSASGRARSTRRSPARGRARVQSARTISRCVMVIGSRPSARGGG